MGWAFARAKKFEKGIDKSVLMWYNVGTTKRKENRL